MNSIDCCIEDPGFKNSYEKNSKESEHQRQVEVLKQNAYWQYHNCGIDGSGKF